jgi:hypothetical protein
VNYAGALTPAQIGHRGEKLVGLFADPPATYDRLAAYCPESRLIWKTAP